MLVYSIFTLQLVERTDNQTWALLPVAFLRPDNELPNTYLVHQPIVILRAMGFLEGIHA
jgi:hypothetical protein